MKNVIKSCIAIITVEEGEQKLYRIALTSFLDS